MLVSYFMNGSGQANAFAGYVTRQQIDRVEVVQVSQGEFYSVTLRLDYLVQAEAWAVDAADFGLTHWQVVGCCHEPNPTVRLNGQLVCVYCKQLLTEKN